MTSDYEAITKHNERQLGLDTASRKTQICMYSDSTHFVYEILQNADDYGASAVLFSLSPSALTIEHDGQSFNTANVEAITYFGKSTSRDDLVKAGRFGVGFKSVFAFTATPIIISGSEHFKIHGLYRVAEYPYPEDLDRRRTRIVLPFNHEEEKPDYVDELMPAKDAYKKIAKRLTGLNMHTLLLTKNLREIRWEIDGQSGHYLREDKRRKGGRETMITDGDAESNYLVFARTPTWRGEEHRNVEVAFGLDKKGLLAPIDDYLYVLFSTTQETHLQFVINGPYRTNPSRETISEEDTFNCHLMKETSELLRVLLPDLRDRGLLTTNTLAVMPNATDRLRPFYSPLFETVVETFRTQDLVPTDEGKFASAANVLQGPAPVREVISNAEIAFLAGKEDACWAKGVVQNTRPDQFLKSLEIAQWGWKQLEEALESKYAGYGYYFSKIDDDDDAAWLDDRTDQWLQKLYLLLADAIARDECSEWTIQRCQIVRVTENRKQKHVPGSKAYFPKGRGYQDLPQVKAGIVRGRNKAQTKKIEEALVSLGVRQIGDEERIDLVLETYYRDEDARVAPQQHLDHMRQFIKWWKKEKSASKFDDEAIFRVVGSEDMHAAESCYLDSPLKTSGLGVIYSASHRGVPERHKLWTKYKELTADGLCDFAIACGVAANLSIEKQDCYHHPNQSGLREDYNRWGVRFTGTAINRDYTIKGLSALLKIKSHDVNRLIWDTVRQADPAKLEAAFRPNRQYELRKDKSSLVIALAKAEWIPDKRGHLRKPSAICKDELHPSFKYDNRNGWLDEIGFGEEARHASAEYKRKKEFATALGVRITIVDQLSSFSPEEQAELQNQFELMLRRRAKAKTAAERNQRESQPFHEALAGTFSQGGGSGCVDVPPGSRTSRNPGRRRSKLQSEIAAGIANEPSPDTRFTFGLCKKWKGKNDQVREKLLHWYGGHCQICSRTFSQRNNEPYFEGLYLVPFTKAEWIDRPGNVLCLCPWHSAMFQFGSKLIDTDLLADIEAFVPRAEGGTSEPVIILTLCGERVTVVFHEDHFLELQTMIQQSQQAAR